MTVNNINYITAAGTVPMDGVTDASAAIQTLIDNNPNRTIYFPDGKYLLSKPVLTPADPKKSVSLCLSSYAEFIAAENWDSDEAMIRLGAKDPANDIRTCGSNYSFSGGIINGSGVASGISIDGGRETVVRDVSIKHTKIGLHIKFGANSGSSDCDISGVNIVGNRARDSIGVLLDGYDNTLTNMRIADVFVGMKINSGGNSLRNIHPLYTCDYTDYQQSCGFYDISGGNWYNFCYSDHFGIGFRTSENAVNIYDSCFCWWYCNLGERQLAVLADGAFNSIMANFKIGFFDTKTTNIVLEEGKSGGCGVFERLLLKRGIAPADSGYQSYLQGKVIEF